MTIKTIRIVVLLGFLCVVGCKDNLSNEPRITNKNTHQMTVTVDTLKKALEAFNRHDLDAIMEYFTDDCSMDFPRGPEPWGQRFVGKAQVREALASRFRGIPDVHYGEDIHWISADGKNGMSEWTLTGTALSGANIKVRGCDLWEFRDGKVARKNSYWKIVEDAAQVKTK